MRLLLQQLRLEYRAWRAAGVPRLVAAVDAWRMVRVERACVRIMATEIAALPVKVFKRR